MSLPKLSVLEAKCKELGLTVTPAGKKLGKADYARELRAHFLPEGGLLYEELTPMTCFAEWNLKPEEQQKVWRSPNWIAQRKLNGCRLIIHFVKGVGVFCHSRTISVVSYRFQELTGKLLPEVSGFIPDFDATIDQEVLVEKPINTAGYTSSGDGELTKTSLHSTTAILHLSDEMAQKIQIDQDAPLMFHTFDITKWKGEDLRKAKLRQRIAKLEEFRQAIEATPIGKYFVFPEVTSTDKRAFADKIIEEGGEGVILKNLDHHYVDSSSRPRVGWVKVKKRIEFDAYVSGFKRGDAGNGYENMVGALEFSVMTEDGPHVLGYASNMTLETRKKISKYDSETDTVTLVGSVYGKVAEISGQDVSARELRLSHCTVDRWRPKDGPDGKRKEACVTSMADLREAAAWVGS